MLIDFKKASICLKTIAHPKKLKMIYFLLQKKASVKELAEYCNLKHNVASEYLSRVKNKGLVSSFKVKKQVFYQIEEDALKNIMGCIEKKIKIGE